jgi:hypothetical protein
MMSVIPEEREGINAWRISMLMLMSPPTIMVVKIGLLQCAELHKNALRRNPSGTNPAIFTARSAA